MLLKVVCNGLTRSVAATTAAATLATSFANAQSIDGVTLATGDRILIKDQASGAENGVYVVAASGAPARASDMTPSSKARARCVFVEQGTTNSDNAFVCTNNEGSDTVGTDSLSFTQFSGAGTILMKAVTLWAQILFHLLSFQELDRSWRGAAMSKTGNQLDVEVDDSNYRSECRRTASEGCGNK